ncbi:unnamed protein product [Heterobilharzia americana]|nr:unnamed protein product [Heterobilharzia americana]
MINSPIICRLRCICDRYHLMESCCSTDCRNDYFSDRRLHRASITYNPVRGTSISLESIGSNIIWNIAWKPLNFFMLFTTVTILSMGLGLLFTDADAVEIDNAFHSEEEKCSASVARCFGCFRIRPRNDVRSSNHSG